MGVAPPPIRLLTPHGIPPCAWCKGTANMHKVSHAGWCMFMRSKNATQHVLERLLRSKNSKPIVLPPNMRSKNATQHVLERLLRSKSSKPIVLPPNMRSKNAAQHVLERLLRSKNSKPIVLP